MNWTGKWIMTTRCMQLVQSKIYSSRSSMRMRQGGYFLLSCACRRMHADWDDLPGFKTMEGSWFLQSYGRLFGEDQHLSDADEWVCRGVRVSD